MGGASNRGAAAMSAPRIPTWQERLASCFRWRHRFMQVFGVPGAVGAICPVTSP